MRWAVMSIKWALSEYKFFRKGVYDFIWTGWFPIMSILKSALTDIFQIRPASTFFSQNRRNVNITSILVQMLWGLVG